MSEKVKYVEPICGVEVDPNEKIIYTYIGIDQGNSNSEHTTYWIYDPETNKHHEVSKEKYDSVMKNAH